MYGTKGVCFYPGNFNPPTKYHLRNVLWLQGQNNVAQVVILLGEDRAGEISQDAKAQILDFYNKAEYSGRMAIEKADPDQGGPYRLLMELLDKRGDETIYIALDEASARSPKINTLFAKFKNVEYIILPSSHDKASERMMEYAQQGNMKKFIKMLPDNMGQAQINQILDLVAPKEKEEEEPVKENYTRMFDDGFWKSVLPVQEAIDAYTPQESEDKGIQVKKLSDTKTSINIELSYKDLLYTLAIGFDEYNDEYIVLFGLKDEEDKGEVSSNIDVVSDVNRPETKKILAAIFGLLRHYVDKYQIERFAFSAKGEMRPKLYKYYFDKHFSDFEEDTNGQITAYVKK